MTIKFKNPHLSRQLDLVPEDILDKQINIIGAGAIGSWTALALMKMGFHNLVVFDHDEVDIVNMSSQFFSHEQANGAMTKVAALKQNLESMSDPAFRLQTIDERWNGSKLSGVTIMAVDSMETRKKIHEANKLNTGAKWIIDARMGAETALIYTVNPCDEKDNEFYVNSLYTDEEAIQERCTAKSTTYCALVLSGLVAKTVRDVLMNKKYMRNMTFSLKENDFLAFSGNRSVAPITAEKVDLVTTGA